MMVDRADTSGKIPNCRYVVQRCFILAICGMNCHGMAGGSHGCCATDYCLVGGRGPASGTGRDFSIAHGTGEPSGASPDHSGLSRRAFGLCRGMRDASEPTDRDAVFGACRRTGSIGSAGRPRAPGTRCENYGGGPNLACWAGLREADAIWLSARAVAHRLLAAHARDHGPRAGHPSLANLAQGTVCKILAAHEFKPHRVRYYLERRDPEFEP